MAQGVDQETIKKGLKLSLIVSLITLLVLFYLTINEETISKLSNVNPWYLILAIIINLLMWTIGGLKIKVIANALGEYISLKSAVQTFLVGSFISNVTPFASGGGPFQVLLLNKRGISLGKSSTIIIVQFIMRLLFFSVLSPIFLLLFPNLIDSGLIPKGLFDLLIIISLLISAIIIYFIWKPEKIKILADKLKNLKLLQFLTKDKRSEELIDRLYQEMDEFHQSLWQLARYNRSSLWWAGLFTVVFWTLFFLIIPVVLLGLDAEPFFFRSFIVQTIFYLILPYLPTPGGSGVAEFGFAALFSSFVPSAILGLVAVVWRFLTFYLVIICGGLILFKMVAKSIVKL